MIPYLHVEPLRLGSGADAVVVHPFGLLVLAAIWIGVILTVRRARRLGLDLDRVDGYIWTMLGCAFLVSRGVDATLYHPGGLLDRPWSLLFVWEGMSSLGGFAGAILGGIAWSRLELARLRRRDAPIPLLPFADLTSAVFPVAWVVGRMGCAIAHDHPGRLAPADSWWAVAYGPVSRIVPLGALGELRWGSAPRYDLGLLEVAFTVGFSAALAATWRRDLPVGTYVVACCLVYPPVRFALDALRARDLAGADLRYAGLTPAQWGCLAMFGVGLAVLRRMRTAAR